MAFISEVDFRGGAAASETVEVTLGPGDDPNDFVVSVYRDDGTLHTGAGIATGEVNLGTLTGVPHPDDPSYTIYTITVGIRNAPSDADEGSAIALTNVTAGIVTDFFGAARVSVTATEGAANGHTADPQLDHRAIPAGQTFQQDINGNTFIGPQTSGDSILCIGEDALIRIADGFKAARDVVPGDLVWTLDEGPKPVLWVGLLQSNQVHQGQPVVVPRAAMNETSPSRDLILSPQHRVLLRSKIVERMFGEAEVLAPATKLCGSSGIYETTQTPSLTFVHIAFETHQIISANGMLVESLFLGPMALRAAQRSISSAMQGLLALGDDLEPARLCRTVVRGKKLRKLLERHAQNAQHLCVEQSDLISAH